MAKKCKKDEYKDPKQANYICKKCERMAKREEKLCKPKKL
jgi:hypothetical protein